MFLLIMPIKSMLQIIGRPSGRWTSSSRIRSESSCLCGDCFFDRPDLSRGVSSSCDADCFFRTCLAMTRQSAQTKRAAKTAAPRIAKVSEQRCSSESKTQSVWQERQVEGASPQVAQDASHGSHVDSVGLCVKPASHLMHRSGLSHSRHPAMQPRPKPSTD